VDTLYLTIPREKTPPLHTQLKLGDAAIGVVTSIQEVDPAYGGLIPTLPGGVAVVGVTITGHVFEIGWSKP